MGEGLIEFVMLVHPVVFLMNIAKWTIYCHTHVASGRRYIGLTKLTMMKRWNRHVYSAGYGRDCRFRFARAIRKYGKDAFSHEVLEVCYNLEVANLAEECWIEFFDTRNPEKGFNLAKGGAHARTGLQRRNPWEDPGYRARLVASMNSAETIAKISAVNKGKVLSPEHKKKLRDSAPGPDARTSVKIAVSLRSYWAGVARRPKVCEVHGVLSPHDCVTRRRADGRVRTDCKTCVLDYKRSHAQREHVRARRNERRRSQRREHRET